ncbi:hypothetical protein BDN70DRAFT_871433 [Pholiota conissans]|uniref:IMD domain-containing protein n=1 Tax=Pholiota conissans TaxID=109636 RepID=A0A9P5ZDE0_9AGAR|nr:hypothetical protein BDN70DRAFT_871433 [Pholiota conissans]
MAPGRARSLRGLAFSSGKRAMSPGPPSPTYSDATHASAINFGSNGPEKIITRANLKSSLQAYEDLVNSCATYRSALITMSKATGELADAMERCSGLKGPTYEAGTRLQAAAGVHHLSSNLWHVLSESLDKSFEKPLRQHLEGYRNVVNERSQNYEKALREKSHVIRETEMRSLNKKQRNLQSFREALSVLQRQVDELDELKLSHYQQIMEHEEEVWNQVQNKVCVLVRSEMDVFDRITAKASDPIIEPMLQSVPDPFDSYGPPQAEDQIFSILAPLSIMTGMSTSSSSPMAGTPERDGIDSVPTSATNKITSWLPATNGTVYAPDPTDWASISSSPSHTPPRSVSPPATVSPPNGSITPRRHSSPPLRKGDSKLRSVLSVIEEAKTRPESGQATPTPMPLPPVVTNVSSEVGWHSAYGQSPYENPTTNTEDGQLTPRSSTPFSSQASSPPPPHIDPVLHRDTDPSDDQAQVAYVAT